MLVDDGDLVCVVLAEHIQENSLTIIEATSADREWADVEASFSVREVTEDVGHFGSGVVVGKQADIADQIESIVHETGLDGFNFTQIPT